MYDYNDRFYVDWYCLHGIHALQINVFAAEWNVWDICQEFSEIANI